MASTGVNVLRYSALGAGVFYGLYHQATLSASAKLNAANREYERKQGLIDRAKKEYVKKTAPPAADGVIRDPEDKNFDLEKYLSAEFGSK
ncbi:hypothetical protein VE04_04756 [Pseudogymnoascus sp. 24MN13]|nr:hypothetical protein VE04_04756 [Pseudogymnoascus sp. 24MN13]